MCAALPVTYPFSCIHQKPLLSCVPPPHALIFWGKPRFLFKKKKKSTVSYFFLRTLSTVRNPLLSNQFLICSPPPAFPVQSADPQRRPASQFHGTDLAWPVSICRWGCFFTAITETARADPTQPGIEPRRPVGSALATRWVCPPPWQGRTVATSLGGGERTGLRSTENVFASQVQKKVKNFYLSPS